MSRLAHAAIVVSVIVACGATNDSAPPVDKTKECAELNERLVTLETLAKAGRFQGFKTAITEHIPDGVRVRLLDLLLQVVDTLPEGTFSGLAPLVKADELKEQLEPLSKIVASVVNNGAPSYEALGKLGTVVSQCTGQPLLLTLRSLLIDPAFRTQMKTVLDSDLLDDELLSKLVPDVTRIDQKDGFKAFIRNLMASISRPQFSPQDLPSFDSPVYTLLMSVLEDPDALSSVQLVTQCMLDSDPENTLPGLLFDLLHYGILDTNQINVPELYPGGLFETLDRLIIPPLTLIVNDSSVRRSAVVVLAALLNPKTAAMIFPDLQVMFEEGVVADILKLLVSVATDSC